MKLLCLIPLVFLGACSTSKPPKLTLHPQEPPPAMDNSAIRYPEVFRAYHVGRYADPNNSLVMNEHHTVYRVEAHSRWNLHPGSDCPVVQELSTTTTNSAFSPPLLSDATLAELNLQKATTAQVMSQAKVLAASLDQLQAVLRQAKLGAEETAALRKLVATLEKRLQTMEVEQGRLAQTLAAPPASESNTNTPTSPFDGK